MEAFLHPANNKVMASSTKNVQNYMKLAKFSFNVIVDKKI